MKKFFGIIILASVISFAIFTACNQPSMSDYYDSTSISVTADTTNPVVDSLVIDTSLLK